MIGCVLVSWLALALSTPTYSCASVPQGAAGYGLWGPHPKVWIRRPWLTGLRRGIGRVTALRAEQVFVLAHELGHAHGAITEAAANFWARTHWGDVVYRLGGGSDKARRLWRALPLEWKALA